MRLDELESVDRAEKPVSIEGAEGWIPGRAYFSVEQVNLQLDQYRWWSVFLTTDIDLARARLAYWRRIDPGRPYRLVMSVDLG